MQTVRPVIVKTSCRQPTIGTSWCCVVDTTFSPFLQAGELLLRLILLRERKLPLFLSIFWHVTYTTGGSLSVQLQLRSAVLPIRRSLVAVFRVTRRAAASPSTDSHVPATCAGQAVHAITALSNTTVDASPPANVSGLNNRITLGPLHRMAW